MIIPRGTVVRVKRTQRRVVEATNGIMLRESFVALIGPNGGGKTAMLKALCGFGPFEMSPSVQAPRRFLYLDHEPLAGVEPWMPALDVARLYLRQSERATRRWLLAAAKVENRFQLCDAVLMRTPIAEISTGQRQALMMLCAQALKVELCIFDESFSALDPLQFEAALEIVTGIAGQLTNSRGCIIVATHDYEVLRRCANAAQVSGMPLRYVTVRDAAVADVTDGPGVILSREAFDAMYGRQTTTEANVSRS